MKKNPVSYVSLLLRQPFLALAVNRRRNALLALSMFVNDILFFALWIVFFNSVRDLNGWHLKELALFQGIVVAGIGLAFFLGDGSRNMASRIQSGELDTYVLRPTHPLPQLICLESSAPSLGDLWYGLFLIALTHPGIEDMFFALCGIISIAALYLSMVVIFQCLAFFTENGGRLADELYNALLCLGTIPQHTQGFFIKLVLFTALPAGFMAIVPVAMVRHHSGALLAVMISAAIVYAVIAFAFFSTGLRRYTSATGWKV